MSNVVQDATERTSISISLRYIHNADTSTRLRFSQRLYVRQERKIGLLAVYEGRQDHVSVGDAGGEEAGGPILRGGFQGEAQLYVGDTPREDLKEPDVFVANQ